MFTLYCTAFCADRIGCPLQFEQLWLHTSNSIVVEQLPRGFGAPNFNPYSWIRWNPVNMVTNGRKKYGRINEGFWQEKYGHFAWRPKKVAIITRWLYYRGGCKVGFYCIYYFFLWVPSLVPTYSLLLRSEYLLTLLQSVELNLSDIWHSAIETDMAQLWSIIIE